MKTLLLFLLVTSVALAQKPDKAVSTLSRSEQAEVRDLARKQVENLQALFNTITFADASEFEVNTVIKNSFLPNANQVFLNDGVIIEDDIDPQHVGLGTPADVPVETYLRNLNLFYTKTEKFSVSFTDIIARNEQVGSRPLVKVYFTSTFTSRHNQIDKPYQPTKRVAEFQIERVGKVWSVLITRLGFITVPALPPPPPQRVQVHKTTKSWLFIAGGIASLVGGYLAYNKTNADYQAYKSQVNALNADYIHWQELSLQPVGSPMTPLSFPAYAGSGGYVIYGAGAAGLGLSLTGITQLVKSVRVAKKQARSTATH